MAAMASKFNFECVIQYYTDKWFHPSTRKHENGVFEILHSGERFRKPLFSHAENAVYVWTQRQTSAYLWTGPQSSVIFKKAGEKLSFNTHIVLLD